MPPVALIDKNAVRGIIEDDPLLVKQIVLRALEIHLEKKLVSPMKQYLQRSSEAHPTDRIIAMSTYIPTPVGIAGIKWIGSYPDNYKIGMERANAVIILNDINTNAPIAILDGSLISSYRTLAISLICIDRVCPTPKVIGCLGMGKLGRLHARFLPKLYPSIERILCYSRADYEDLLQDSVIEKCSTYRDSLAADVVITATATAEPYITANDIPENVLLINLSLMDYTLDVFQISDVLVVDDLEQCLRARKVFNRGVEEGLIDPAAVYELSDLVYGRNRDKPLSGKILVSPIGMAVEDILVAKAIYDILHDLPYISYFDI